MRRMTKVEDNWAMSLSACKFEEMGHKTHLSLAENKHPGAERCEVQRAGGKCPLTGSGGREEVGWRRSGEL